MGEISVNKKFNALEISTGSIITNAIYPILVNGDLFVAKNISTQTLSTGLLIFGSSIGIHVNSLTVSTGSITTNTQNVNTISSGVIRTSGLSSIGISSGSIFTSSLITLGNVGINCNAPTTTLDVNGNVNIVGNITNSNGHYTGINESFFITPNTANRPIAITAQSTGMYIFRPSNGNSRIHLNTLSGNTIISSFVVSEQGFVGIGCNVPNDRLSVVGNIRTASNVLVGVNAANYPMATAGYANVSMVGGNSHGFMFGAFAGHSDGLHLSYNYLHNNSSIIIPVVAGGTSLLSMQYGAMQFNTGAAGTSPSTRMTLTNTGLGIGTTNPFCPLDIAISTSLTIPSGWNWFSDGNNGAWSGSDQICLRARGTIWSERRLIISSDERIKKDIVDINDNEALYDLRNIQPKKYKYIDQLSRGNNQYYGFIAQQISSVFNDAVETQYAFIPNIYRPVSSIVSLSNESTIITLLDIPEYFISSIQIDSRVKIYDFKNKEILTSVSSISSNTINVISPTNNTNEITMFSSTLFVYGSEVHDFLTLNKDYLFTLNFAATQEIDRIQQQHVSTISSMQTQLEHQQSTINYLLSRV